MSLPTLRAAVPVGPWCCRPSAVTGPVPGPALKLTFAHGEGAGGRDIAPGGRDGQGEAVPSRVGRCRMPWSQVPAAAVPRVSVPAALVPGVICHLPGVRCLPRALGGPWVPARQL